MKELTAILAFLLLLTSCRQSSDSSDSPPITSADNTAISAEEKEVGAEVITTTASTSLTVTITSISVTQPTTAAIRETTAVSVTEPVSTSETAETHSEEQSTPDTTQAAETPQTAVSEVITTAPTTTTKAVQQTVPTTTVVVTESPTEAPTEPKTVLPNDGTNYDKAKSVYDYMIENGHGTCVNYACQTYELCQDIGLNCYLVWTDAGLYGHVANIVNVDGIWYVLDTEGGFFLDYNYCFTEVVDIDGNHIADSDIISGYSYAELH